MAVFEGELASWAIIVVLYLGLRVGTARSGDLLGDR